MLTISVNRGIRTCKLKTCFVNPFLFINSEKFTFHWTKFSTSGLKGLFIDGHESFARQFRLICIKQAELNLFPLL